MTITERIMSFLQDRSEGIDDDDLAKALGFKARQQANSRCRQLEKEGLVIRRRVQGKIHNFWAGNPIPDTLVNTPYPSDDVSKFELWFWEGNVQAQVVRHLESQHYHIRFVADTARHQQGKDIVAERNGKQLWVSVKGYPKGTAKTNPSVQAGHWFKQAIFDIVEYRGQDKNVLLGVALPDYPRYHSLAKKITWFKPVADFRYFWVKQNGEMSVE